MKIMVRPFLAIMLAASLVYADEAVPEKRFVATIGDDGYQHVEMTAGSYYFDPNVVVVKVDVPVTLTIKKESGITPHNFVLKAPDAGLDVDIDISTEPKSVSFMATKTGTYPFECTHRFLFFKSHKDRGMHGVLEVVD